jgi:hypothetical protein
VTALEHIVNVKRHKVAPAQLAVDGEIEQREFPDSMIQLQSNPDGPDLLQLQRWLLADQLPFVPWYYTPLNLACGVGNGIHEWLLRSRRGAVC